MFHEGSMEGENFHHNVRRDILEELLPKILMNMNVINVDEDSIPDEPRLKISFGGRNLYTIDFNSLRSYLSEVLIIALRRIISS